MREKGWSSSSHHKRLFPKVQVRLNSHAEKVTSCSTQWCLQRRASQAPLTGVPQLSHAFHCLSSPPPPLPRPHLSFLSSPFLSASLRINSARVHISHRPQVLCGQGLCFMHVFISCSTSYTEGVQHTCYRSEGKWTSSVEHRESCPDNRFHSQSLNGELGKEWPSSSHEILILQSTP